MTNSLSVLVLIDEMFQILELKYYLINSKVYSPIQSLKQYSQLANFLTRFQILLEIEIWAFGRNFAFRIEKKNSIYKYR